MRRPEASGQRFARCDLSPSFCAELRLPALNCIFFALIHIFSVIFGAESCLQPFLIIRFLELVTRQGMFTYIQMPCWKCSQRKEGIYYIVEETREMRAFRARLRRHLVRGSLSSWELFVQIYVSSAVFCIDTRLRHLLWCGCL